jgi:hypothetical protein
MNGRTLRSTAGLAGTFAAAAAGALTVGLISGVVHTAQAASTPVTSTTGSGSTSTSGNTSGASNSRKSTSGIASVPQNAQPVGGSHGS